MAIRGQWGIGRESPCSYLPAQTARLECLTLDVVDEPEFEALLEQGYRHFGTQFFRPFCRTCGACIPLRVSTAGFRQSRTVRRALARAAHLRFEVSSPQPGAAAHRLYCLHKERFRDTNPETPTTSYSDFVAAFYHPYPFSYVLAIRDGQRLVAVSHFDLTAHCLSAVYCYYDPADLACSPGRLALYYQIRLAQERAIPYVHLGYYVAANCHMRYKARFRPSQVLIGAGQWVPFVDGSGHCALTPEQLARGFHPPGRPRLG